MARSVNTIFNSILAAKEANADLAVINTTSKTSIYRLWAWITATAIFTVETMHDLFLAEIEGILANQKPGTLQWYQLIAKQFQYGDAVLVDDRGLIAYSAIDSSKQIVTQCSTTENAEGITIKIAKTNAGELMPLSTDEENAFQAYMSKRKYAGAHLFIINSNSNLLKITGVVYYNPLVMTPAGTLINDGSRPVDLAIDAFLKNLPFDGILRRNLCVDSVLAATGVDDFQLVSLQHKYSDNNYEEIAVNHKPESGYFKIDPLFPLTVTIIYVANV